MLRCEFFDKVFVLLLKNEPFNAWFSSSEEQIKVSYTSGSLTIQSSVSGLHSFFINDEYLNKLENVLQTQKDFTQV